MSINLNSIRDILNIKDVNISFSDNPHIKEKFRYVDSHFFFASLLLCLMCLVLALFVGL